MSMEILDRYSEFRGLVASQFSEKTRTMVDDALLFADRHLGSMRRYDGTPMLNHGVAMARIIIEEIGLGRNSTVAAILHDVVRIATQEHHADLEELTHDIRQRYGEEVLGITLALCKISDIKLKISKEQVSDFRDMIVSYSEDPRVILIKLADRLEVMRSLDMFPDKKRRDKSWESLNLYAQIAHKLGLYSIKSELEDLSLKYLDPDAYNSIVHELKESETERLAFIERFLKPVRELLDKDGMKYHIKSRTKSVFSIFGAIFYEQIVFTDLEIINKNFGSLENFKKEFEKEANSLFGSGYVWLSINYVGECIIHTSKDANNPIQAYWKPILCLDLWEHSYYIDYRNDRKRYIS